MNIQSIIMTLLVTTISLMTACSNPPAKYQPIVQAIEGGTLTRITDGVIKLPPELAGITPRDEIYIEKKADGRMFVLFPTDYGRGDDLDGYLYCSGGLLPSDYYSIDWGAGSGGTQQHINVAGKQMLSVEEYQPNWYRVTRRLD